MNVVIHEAGYGRIELNFAEHLVTVVQDTLRAQGIALPQLAPLAEAVAFSVACLVDGCYELMLDGRPLYPVLTYAQQEVGVPGPLTVPSSGATSDLHSKAVCRAAGEPW